MRRHPNQALSRAVFIVLTLLASGCDGEDKEAARAPPAPRAAPGAQQPSPPAEAPLSDLESLVAPIALYPDPLLAELLVASTYPPEIVQAEQWLASKPDPATLKTQDWDASVIRLTEVPSVIKMMSDHLAWTTQLGNTFLARPDDVMASIQALRKRATDSGFLKDTPQQKVTTKTVSEAPAAEEQAVETDTVKATPAVLKKEVIYIEPAKSDTVYVPQYNPETVYSAPLAPAPATGAAYPATTAGYAYPATPAPSYYPVPTATTTTSDTNQLLTFGAGALVGGLLTWGIMEWADDDDDDYHVAHHYGDAVCRNGNCWHGGGYYGGGYRGDVNVDRGDINRNRNVNISGNEITVNRNRTFSQSQLASLRQQPAAWTHDVRHRRGERYPEAAQKRLGQIQQPALAGQRLGAAQTLPADSRGFGQPGARIERPASVGTLPAERRPSAAEIQERLAQKPGAQGQLRPGRPDQRPSTSQIQERLKQGPRENALEGIRAPGQQARLESRRGSESRQIAKAETREARPRGKTAAGQRLSRQPMERAPETQVRKRAAPEERRPELSRKTGRAQTSGGGSDRTRQMDKQRRAESARPNAFEGARDAGSSRKFSQRGAASRERKASTGHGRAGHRGGGGKGKRGGGGHRR